MTSPLVSVVIPTFNRGYCLGRAIESVLGQTHGRIEVIVVDDGGTDDTAQVVEAYRRRDDRVRYVRRANAGPAAARNTGIRRARGEFVVFLDSDDAFEPWLIELELACLARLPQVGMIWSDFAAVAPDGTVRARRGLRLLYGAYRHFQFDELFTESRPLAAMAPALVGETGPGTVYWGDIYSSMILGNLVVTSSTMLRRERLEKVGEFDESLRVSGEDHDFHLRSCREGPVALIDAAGFRYRVEGADQLTSPVYDTHIARNYLRTIRRAIDRDRGRITLPPRRIDRAIAYGEALLGTSLVHDGDIGAGRRHLLRSLRLRPIQPRAILLVLYSLLPGFLKPAAALGYRGLKKILSLGPGTAWPPLC
jgi:glycosyltransferase involved in cell wall biosynthesis